MTMLLVLLVCAPKARPGVVTAIDPKKETITFNSRGTAYVLKWTNDSKVRIDSKDAKAEKIGAGDAGNLVFDDESMKVISAKLDSRETIARRRQEEQEEAERQEHAAEMKAERRRKAMEESEKADKKDRQVQQDISLRVIDSTDRFTGTRQLTPAEAIIFAEEPRKYRISIIPMLVITDKGERAGGFHVKHIGKEWRYLKVRRIDFLIDGKKPTDNVEVDHDGETSSKYPQISEIVSAAVSDRDFQAMGLAKKLEMRIGEDVHQFDDRQIKLLADMLEQSKKPQPVSP